MSEFYVRGKSKKEINERLTQGEDVFGTNYSMFSGGGTFGLKEIPDGSTIKVYEKMVGGNPYAKAYGTWMKGKVK
jgi:ribosomal protein L2